MTDQPSGYGACLFCREPFTANRPDSGEHVWSDWLSKASPGPVLPVTWRRTTPGRSDQERTYKSKPYREKVSGFCVPCNTGWMSRTEMAVKQWALPLIEGRSKALHETGQCRLSQWAIVKTLAWGASGKPHERLIDQRYYDAMYAVRDTLEVPRTFEVYAAQYGGSRVDISHVLCLTPAVNEDGSSRFPDDNWYVATHVINHLALRVFGRDIGGLTELRQEGTQPAIRRIAPFGGSFVFPPGPALSEQGLEVFMGRSIR